jgi:hypothetical protein
MPLRKPHRPAKIDNDIGFLYLYYANSKEKVAWQEKNAPTLPVGAFSILFSY